MISLISIKTFTQVRGKETKLDKKTGIISLNIKHSKRIPFNKIKIKINAFKKDSITVKVISKPSSDAKKWEYSKRDTLFVIDKKQFDKIAENVLNIKANDIYTTLTYMYMDGYSTEMIYSGLGNEIVYRVKSPAEKDKNGYIPYYRESCIQILKLAGFNDKEIDLIL